jgi:hypothetical protein
LAFFIDEKMNSTLFLVLVVCCCGLNYVSAFECTSNETIHTEGGVVMTQCGATAKIPAYLKELTFKDNLVCSSQCSSRLATAATACSSKSASLKAIYASVVGTFSDSIAMRCDPAYQFKCTTTKTVPDIPLWKSELTYIKEQCGYTEALQPIYDHGKACSDACRTKVKSMAFTCANTVTDAAAVTAMSWIISDLEMRCDATYSFNCQEGGQLNIPPRMERNIVQDLCGIPRAGSPNAVIDPTKACSSQCKIRANKFINTCKTVPTAKVIIDESVYTPTVAALAAVQCPQTAGKGAAKPTMKPTMAAGKGGKGAAKPTMAMKPTMAAGKGGKGAAKPTMAMKPTMFA